MKLPDAGFQMKKRMRESDSEKKMKQTIPCQYTKFQFTSRGIS